MRSEFSDEVGRNSSAVGGYFSACPARVVGEGVYEAVVVIHQQQLHPPAGLRLPDFSGGRARRRPPPAGGEPPGPRGRLPPPSSPHTGAGKSRTPAPQRDS